MRDLVGTGRLTGWVGFSVGILVKCFLLQGVGVCVGGRRVLVRGRVGGGYPIPFTLLKVLKGL